MKSKLQDSFLIRSMQIENVKLGLYKRRAPSDPDGNRTDILHTHPFYEFFAVVGSAVNVSFKGLDERLENGEIIIVPPDLPHTRHVMREADGSCVAIGISIEKLRGAYGNDLWKHFKSIFNPRTPQRFKGCHSAISRLCLAINDLTEHDGLSDMLNLLEALNVLSKLTPTPLLLKEQPTNGKAANSNLERIAHVNYLIGTDHTKPITANDVAAAIHLSRRQLDRTVKQRYGKTAAALIKEKQLEIAKDLCLNTELNVEQIALRSGFSDGEALRRSFKSALGCTPREFRRQNKRQEKR